MVKGYGQTTMTEVKRPIQGVETNIGPYSPYISRSVHTINVAQGKHIKHVAMGTNGHEATYCNQINLLSIQMRR